MKGPIAQRALPQLAIRRGRAGVELSLPEIGNSQRRRLQHCGHQRLEMAGRTLPHRHLQAFERPARDSIDWQEGPQVARCRLCGRRHAARATMANPAPRRAFAHAPRRGRRTLAPSVEQRAPVAGKDHVVLDVPVVSRSRGAHRRRRAWSGGSSLELPSTRECAGPSRRAAQSRREPFPPANPREPACPLARRWWSRRGRRGPLSVSDSG